MCPPCASVTRLSRLLPLAVANPGLTHSRTSLAISVSTSGTVWPSRSWAELGADRVPDIPYRLQLGRLGRLSARDVALDERELRANSRQAPADGRCCPIGESLPRRHPG